MHCSAPQVADASAKKKAGPLKVIAGAIAGIVIVFILGLFVVAFFNYNSKPESVFSNAPSSTPPVQPVMGWRKVLDDTFVMDAGGVRVGYLVPQTNVPFKPKIEISARAPVAIAYIPESYREQMLRDPKNVLQLNIFRCLHQHVLSTTLQCPLDTSTEGYNLVIVDERTAADAVGAGILGGLGIKEPAQQALVRNDVRINYSAWGCVSNCAR